MKRLTTTKPKRKLLLLKNYLFPLWSKLQRHFIGAKELHAAPVPQIAPRGAHSGSSHHSRQTQG